MTIKNIVSVSGGKDSTALWLYAVTRGYEVTPVFADTGNEHTQTYEYLDYLEKQLGKITRVKADFTEQISMRRVYIRNKWPDKGVPEEIARIVEWERTVALSSKRGSASFFPWDEVKGKSIWDHVEWSKTSFGGRQYNLEKMIGFEDVPTCSSQYGLCE